MSAGIEHELLAVGSTHGPGDVRKFPCKQCGAQLSFSPGQTLLECAHCGHREQIPTTPEEIAAVREYDLEAALASMPQTTGWGEERRSVACENCGAVSTFEPGQVAGQCAFCGSNKIVERPSEVNVIQPETLVPFRVRKEEATAQFRTWISKLWFRPNNLKHAGQLAKISGAYLPFWTYDAFTASSWTAMRGWHYYETETYTETDSNGNTVTRTRQVQRTRWEPAWGTRQDFFDDELVCASRGLPPKLIQGVCPFDLAELQGYQPAFLSGFTAEEYQVDLGQGWLVARERMESAIHSRCAGDVGGDTHRDLHVDTAWSQMTWKHLLLPIWVAAYLYNGKSYRFLVNGQTGKATGEAPLSWWKIGTLILVIVLIVVGIVLFLRWKEGQTTMGLGPAAGLGVGPAAVGRPEVGELILCLARLL